MTVAKELAERGLPVFLIEGSKRLGGKAGAERYGQYVEDHGFHVFPAWYLNTRALLSDLACDGNLDDFHRFHFLSRGEFPRYVSTHEFSSLGGWLQNLFTSVLPRSENLLSYFALLELACEPFSHRSFLDRVSASGFLRSRPYATDSIAAYHHQSVLQASAVPDSEFSAMTLQKVIRLWMWHPSPLYSVLNTDLQDGFITPFKRRLCMRGVSIHTDLQVKRLLLEANRVSGIVTQKGADELSLSKTILNPAAGDIFVLATPHHVSWDILRGSPTYAEDLVGTQKHADADGEAGTGSSSSESGLLNADNFGLANLAKLQSVPIVSLHIHLKRRLANIPPEHINLVGSRYGITLIDVGQHWDDLDHTALNLNATNYAPLAGLAQHRIADVLIDELLEYFPQITRADFATEPCLQTHDRQPLFLNTTGAWQYRPVARTSVPNLYVAGDYCRTQVDFTTMESAVMSGMRTAGAILEDLGRPAIAPKPLSMPPLALLWALRSVAAPLVAPLAAWKWADRQLRELRQSPWW